MSDGFVPEDEWATIVRHVPIVSVDLVVVHDDVFAPDDQHAELRVFRPPFDDLHPYVEAYLRDAGVAED